jgi:translation initiation factor IF-2
MGHVNHGKTSLLDAIRLRHGGPGPGADVEPGYIPDADAPPAVTATVEAGDITQAMSAFSVDLGGRQRGAFIDTPGHAAFARMRERGVMVTDVALVVVDAVQGVQNQTRETLQLLAQTKPPTPVVLALNKCDLLAPHEVEAARAKVSTQIMELGFATEEHGGDVQMVGVSAKTSQGLGDLEEAVLLQAEMSELRAAPKEARGEAVVLEARTEPGVGPTVDALVTWGGLAVGDHVVCGHEWGKVRELTGTFGRAIGPEGAGASEPVRLVGLSGVPSAGDELIQARDEEHAKRVAEARAARSAARAEAEEAARIAAERQRHDERRRALEAAVAARQRELGRRLRPAERTELTDAFKRDADARFAAASVAKTGAAAPIPTASLAAGSARGDADAASAAASALAEAVDAHDPDKPAVSVLLKADSDGALETMLAEIEAIPQRKLSLRVVGRGVGPVTKRDLFKAETHGAAIFGFNVKVPRKMQDLADQENIAIRTDPIIYTVVDQLREHMQEALPPVTEESLLGQAKVLQTFEITKAGRRTFEVAGVKVFSGEIKRNSKFRLLRGKDVVFEARRLASMRHFKERVNVMKQGSECAVALEGWEERDAADESLQFREGDVLQSFEEVQKKQSLV